MSEFLIFYGPTDEFKNYLSNDENTLSLYEMLDYAKFINNKEDLDGIADRQYDSIFIYSTDYASLSESGEKGLHNILKYFIELYDIKKIHLQNPTKIIENNFILMVENNDEYTIHIENYKYPALTKRDLVNVYKNFSSRIIGQDKTKADIMSALYTLYKKRNDNKPLVLMFYGPSGVGKTETAKFISEIIDGSHPIRTQISMFQNQNSVNYLFGESHDANSFALDLLKRKTNHNQCKTKLKGLMEGKRMYNEPIFLQPVFKERIWGGQKLNTIFGYDIPTDKTGEAWVISAHENGPSEVINGPLKGEKLSQVWNEHPELFGKSNANEEFPLLVKLLDANSDLSVKVHPGDKFAREIEGKPYGKTECWYVRKRQINPTY